MEAKTRLYAKLLGGHLSGSFKGIWQYIFILAYRQEPLK